MTCDWRRARFVVKAVNYAAARFSADKHCHLVHVTPWTSLSACWSSKVFAKQSLLCKHRSVWDFWRQKHRLVLGWSVSCMSALKITLSRRSLLFSLFNFQFKLEVVWNKNSSYGVTGWQFFKSLCLTTDNFTKQIK